MVVTKRLRCEPVTPGHAEAMYPVLVDARIYTYSTEKPPASVEAQRKRYLFLSAGKSPDGTEHWLNWMLLKRDTGEPIGFFQATIRPARCSIAYILNPRFWRNGFAREASCAIIAHLFERYAMPSVVAEINPLNEPSIRLVKRLGFSFIRHDRDEGDDIFEMMRPRWIELNGR